MKSNIEFGLEGAFKVDLFSGNKLMETTDWFSNFITHTGLNYPSIFPFADCFRFLSIGSGTVGNSGYNIATSSVGTVNLEKPITTYATTAGPQPGVYMGFEGYEIGDSLSQSACGTMLTEQGPAFFRAWSIPSGDIGITMANNLNIQELMVSPSSGTAPVGASAFSRILRSISIPKGWRSIISYQLKVKIQNTGMRVLTAGSFVTGNADITTDEALVRSWAGLSGYYRQVYHGLACVDKNGATYISKFGCIMEPSLTNLNNSIFYLSPDNAAFDVNGYKGGFQSKESLAYSADGLMDQYVVHNLDLSWKGQDLNTVDKAYYYYAPLSDKILDSTMMGSNDANDDVPINIRLGSADLAIKTPSTKSYLLDNSTELNNTFNYQVSNDASIHEISYATPGFSGLDDNKANYKQKAVFSTRVFQLPFDVSVTGRKKTRTRKTLFAPVSSLGTNTRFGSMVYAFNAGEDLTAAQASKSFYPMIDCLFFDTSGRSLMKHYRIISGIYLTERGTGVAEATFSILPVGTNINRFASRKAILGKINGGIIDDPNGYFTDRKEFFWAGEMKDRPGDMGDLSVGYSGWGAVLGASGDDYSLLNYDTALIDHNVQVLPGNIAQVIPTTLPNPSGMITPPVYWDNPNTPLYLSITNIKFYKNGIVYQDSPSSSAAILAGSGLCRPTGKIVHYEDLSSSIFANSTGSVIGPVGGRLLPNHGVPNNTDINIYPTSFGQAAGGYYPGLSMDNGLELYLDISWTAPCPPGTANCSEIPLP
jgi:hypothetical protein